MIIILPLVAALTAGLVSRFVLKPVYSTSTTIWVIKKEAASLDYNTLLLNRSLVPTYAQIARSRSVMDEVIKNLGLTDVTAEDLQKKLTVDAVNITDIIEMSVEDKNPENAARLADAIAAAFSDQISKFISLENVGIVDKAEVPLKPVKPRPVRNTAIAFALGLMAAMGLAFLLEYLDTSIKSVDDIERVLGLPVLGTIPLIDLPKENHTPAHGKARNKAGVTRRVWVNR